MRTMRLAVVTCFLLLSSGWAQQIKARLLYDLIGTKHSLLPVVVELKTQAPFDGNVVARESNGSTQRVSRTIKVGQGKFRFELPLILTPQTMPKSVTVSLVTKSGKVVAEEVVPCGGLNVDKNCWVIGWIDAPKQFVMHSFDIRGGKLSPHDAMPDYVTRYDRGSQDGTVRIRQLDHEALPKDWRMYRGLDVIVIGRGGAKSMNRQQHDALEKWVVAGGSLIVGTTALDGANGPFADGFSGKRHWGKNTVMHHGLGRVFCASEAFRFADSDHRKFCRKVVQDLVLSKGMIRSGQWTNPSYGYNSYGLDWQERLWMWVDLERISKKVLLGFIILFFVVVGILDRVVLKLMKRRHWTWFTVPIIVAVFCFGAHKLSTISRGFKPRMTGVHVHDYGPDGSGLHHSLLCFTPPSSKNYSMSFVDGWATRHPGFEVKGKRGSTHATMSLNKDTFHVSSPAWTPVFIETTIPHRDTSPFSVRFQPEGDRLVCCGVTVPEDTGTILRSYLLVGSQVFEGHLVRDAEWVATGSVRTNPGIKRIYREINQIVSRSQLFKIINAVDFERYMESPDYYYDELRNRVDHADIGFILFSAATTLSRPIVPKDTLSSPTDDRLAWLIVISDRGPEARLTRAVAMRSKGIHVYRQLVRLETTDGSGNE